MLFAVNARLAINKPPKSPLNAFMPASPSITASMLYDLVQCPHRVVKQVDKSDHTAITFVPTKAVRARDVLSLAEDMERIMRFPFVRISVIKGRNAFLFELFVRKPPEERLIWRKTNSDNYAQAVTLVRRERKASISFIQRHLEIGYNAAASIMGRMEKEGIVSEADHVGKRIVRG